MKKPPRKKRRPVCKLFGCRETREHYAAAQDRIDELTSDFTTRLKNEREKNRKLEERIEHLESQRTPQKSDTELLLDRSFKEIESLATMKRFFEENP